MDESSKDNIPKVDAEKLDEDGGGNLPVLLVFYLKSGAKTHKTALIKKEKFQDFRKSIMTQLTKEGNVWFYFIENESPHRSSLLRIEDISCFEFFEYDELTNKEESIFLNNRKSNSSLYGGEEKCLS